MRQIKLSFFYFSLFALLQWSCAKNKEYARCQSAECLTYQEIWKSILMKQNDMSEAWFQKHIQVVETRIDTWRSGRSFRVDFQIKNAWTEVRVVNKFIIEISDNGAPYPTLQLPYNQALTQEEIERALTLNAHSSHVYPIDCNQLILFDSEDEALEYLQNQSGNYRLNFSGLALERSSQAAPSKGHILLKAFAQSNNTDNICFDASVDLQDKTILYRKTACRVF